MTRPIRNAGFRLSLLLPVLAAGAEAPAYRHDLRWGAAVGYWLTLDPARPNPDGLSELDTEPIRGEGFLQPKPGHAAFGLKPAATAARPGNALFGIPASPEAADPGFCQWRPWRGTPGVGVDALSYWYAEFVSPSAGTARLSISAPIGHLAWWNGFPVSWHRAASVEGNDSPAVSIPLRSGINFLMIKLSGVGGGQLQARILPPGTDEDDVVVRWNGLADEDGQEAGLQVRWLDEAGGVLGTAESPWLPIATPVKGLDPRWGPGGWTIRQAAPGGTRQAQWEVLKGGTVVARKVTDWPVGKSLALGPADALPCEVELREFPGGSPVDGMRFHDWSPFRADALGGGRYRLVEWDALHGVVFYTGAGYRGGRLRAVPGQPAKANIGRAENQLSGKVVEENGKALENALVVEVRQNFYRTSSFGPEVSGRTNASGEFSVPCEPTMQMPRFAGFEAVAGPAPKGSFDLLVSAEGHVPCFIRRVPDQPVAEPLVLQRGREISGRLAWGESGEACPFVFVSVKAGDGKAWAFHTGADGRFRTWMPEQAGITCRVEIPGPGLCRSFDIPPNGPFEATWTLPPPERVEVIVRDPHGDPVQGARIGDFGVIQTDRNGSARAANPWCTDTWSIGVRSPIPALGRNHLKVSPGVPLVITLPWTKPPADPGPVQEPFAWWLALPAGAAPGPLGREERRSRADALITAWSPPEDVWTVIARLSAEDFAVREAATRQLISFGDAATGELETARELADPEAAARISDILYQPRPADLKLQGWQALDQSTRLRILRKTSTGLVALLGEEFEPWCEERIARIGQARLIGQIPDDNPLAVIFRELESRSRRDLLEAVIARGCDSTACLAADTIGRGGDWAALAAILGKLPPERLARCPYLAKRAAALKD